MFAACTGGDPWVGTWTLEQHLSGPPVAGCPTTTMTTRTVTIALTGTAHQYDVHSDDGIGSIVTADHDQLVFEGLVPTDREDVGSAGYTLEPGGAGLVGTAAWLYLISGTSGDPPADCPILDVRSL
jgi:hypothetical protein